MLDKYLDKKKLSFYRVDMDDPHSRLTSDLEAYSREVTHLLGYFLKPLIDVTHLTFVIGSRVGVRALGIFLCFALFSDFALKRVKNSLPKSLKECAIETQRLESSLRDRHSKLHSSREQIALQRGAELEKKVRNAAHTPMPHSESKDCILGLLPPHSLESVALLPLLLFISESALNQLCDVMAQKKPPVFFFPFPPSFLFFFFGFAFLFFFFGVVL